MSVADNCICHIYKNILKHCLRMENKLNFKQDIFQSFTKFYPNVQDGPPRVCKSIKSHSG